MTDTTTISKIHTLYPTYKFTIDFIGRGSDVHLGKISKKHAIRFKDRDDEGLSNIVKLHVLYGTPQGLRSEIPNWAFNDWIGAEGIDLSKPHEMVVRDEGQNILFVNDYHLFEIFGAVNDNEVVDTSSLDRSASYLHVTDTYPTHNQFSIETDKPFDPALLQMKTIEIDGCRFIDELWYDGVEYGRAWKDWHFQPPETRLIKIIHN